MPDDGLSSEDSEVKAAIDKHHNAAEESFSPERDNILKYWRCYNSYRNPELYRTQSNLFIPLVYSFIQNAMAQALQETLTAPLDYDYITLRADYGSSEYKAFLKTKVLNRQMRRMKYPRRAMEFSLQGMVAGSSCAKMFVDDTPKYVFTSGGWKLNPSFLQSPFEFVAQGAKEDMWIEEPPKEKKIFDDFPAMDVQDILEVRVQACPPNWDLQSNAVEFCKWLPLSYVKEHSDIYHNTDKIEGKAYTPSGEDKNTGVPPPEGSRADQVFIRELWHSKKISEREWRPWLSVDANGIPIRSERNPFWHQSVPGIWGVPTLRPFSLYGESEVKPVFGMQMYFNDIINNAVDNINLQANQMYTLLTSAGLNISEIMAEPGKVITLNKDGELKPLIHPNISRDVPWITGMLQSLMQFTLSANNAIMGASANRQEAATTIVNMMRQAGIRYAMKSYLLVRAAMVEMIEHMIWLNRQYFRKPYVFTYRDENGQIVEEIIEPDLWEGTDEVIINLDPLRMNEEVVRGQLMNVFMFLERNKVLNVDKTEMLKQVLRSFSEFPNLYKIVKKGPMTLDQVMNVLSFLDQGGSKVALSPQTQAQLGITGGPGPSNTGAGPGGANKGGFNPRTSPRATNPADVRKGMVQVGQANAGGSREI